MTEPTDPRLDVLARRGITGGDARTQLAAIDAKLQSKRLTWSDFTDVVEQQSTVSPSMLSVIVFGHDSARAAAVLYAEGWK